jgi:hypothetical protein
VGFVEFNRDGSYWSERRAMEFLLTQDGRTYTGDKFNGR